jgi:hypothetical protein
MERAQYIMPGSFPYIRRPNPEDNNEEPEEQTAYVQEASTQGLPPEAQGETNGGPLGCCLGIIVGIMLGLFFGLIGFGYAAANVIVFLIHVDMATNFRIATAFFALVGAVPGAYLGWKIGKRLYREYELSPKQQAKLDRLNQRQLTRYRQRR